MQVYTHLHAAALAAHDDNLYYTLFPFFGQVGVGLRGIDDCWFDAVGWGLMRISITACNSGQAVFWFFLVL